MKTILLALVACLAACAVDAPTTDDYVGDLITTSQCTANAVKGKVTICHRTASASNPYVQIKVSVSACYEGHGGHNEDYIPANGVCQDAAVVDDSDVTTPPAGGSGSSVCTGPGGPACYTRDPATNLCVQLCI